jgi:hypothetical protein
MGKKWVANLNFLSKKPLAYFFGHYSGWKLKNTHEADYMSSPKRKEGNGPTAQALTK